MDTLEKFTVSWTHIQTEKSTPTSSLDHLILNRICEEAAAGVERQCAREYWSDTENPRATQLHKLSEQERCNIPAENLNCERYRVSKSTTGILKELNFMEIKWTNKQKDCLRSQIKDAVLNNSRKYLYKDTVLKRCKEHGGPITTMAEIQLF
jgi:hypothetical protein